jgi:hypothetical protein
MRKLRHWRTHGIFDEFFAPATGARVELAPARTPHVSDLRHFDFVSGGAITHSAIFALARIPNVRGKIRVIDNDTNNISNANRYLLLNLERLALPKAVDLATQHFPGLSISPLNFRYEAKNLPQIGRFAPAVLVGVDHIPTRWDVQQASPDWLGISATSHYGMMFTAHERNLPCARCAHPVDDPDFGDIPTVSFVSFWAGLFLAARYARSISCGQENPNCQQIWFCPIRPEAQPSLTPVQFRASCQCGRRNSDR